MTPALSPARALWCRGAGWLVLALLALSPCVARAQHGPPTDAGMLWDFLCITGKAPCMKFRVGPAGGAIFSARNAAPALGLRGSVMLQLDDAFDVGVDLLAMRDARTKNGTDVGTVGGLVRIGVLQQPRHRLFVELSGGFSFEDGSGQPIHTLNAGGAGLTLELGERYAGAFLNVGLNMVSADRWLGVPHTSLGLFF